MSKTVIVTATNGMRFKLLKDQMVEADSRTYSALRLDLRNAWRRPRAVRLPYVFPHVDGGRATNLVELRFNGDVEVEIGCKRFTGENFHKLKAWAGVDR